MMAWLWFALGFGACALLVAIAAGIERDRSARLQRLELNSNEIAKLLERFGNFERFCQDRFRELREPEPQTVSVLLFGEGLELEPKSFRGVFMSMSVALQPNEVRRLYFAPQVVIGPGAWLVVVGRGLISNITVGKFIQSVALPSHGPVAVLRDPIQISQHVGFDLQLEAPAHVQGY